MNANVRSIARRDFCKAGGALVVTLRRSRGRPAPAAAARRCRGQDRVAPTRSTAFSPSTPTARSPSTPARSISAPACAPRSRRSPPRNSTCRSSRVTVDPGRHGAYARPGHDLGQPLDPERRHADPPRRRRPRGRHCSTQAAAELGVAVAALVDRETASCGRRTAGATGLPYRQADRRQGLRSSMLDARRAAKGADRLHDRRQVGAAPRHSGQGHRPLHLHAGFPVAGHAARARDPAAGASARRSSRSTSCRCRQVPGIVKRRAERQFPRRRRPRPNGRDPSCAARCEANWSDWEGLPDQAKLWEHVRGTRSSATTSPATSATRPRRWDRAAQALRDLRLRDPHAWLDRSFLRRRRATWTASSPAGPRRRRRIDLRKQLATMLGDEAQSDVRCIYLEGSGCYGRNGHEDAAADAALLARGRRCARCACSGCAQDEHGWDPKGPPTLLDMRAGTRRKGNVARLGSRRCSSPTATAISWRWWRPSSRACPAEQRASRASIHQRLGHPLRLPEREDRWRIGSPRRRSSRPGSARPDACRTPSPTSASSTRLPLQPAPIRSSFA